MTYQSLPKIKIFPGVNGKKKRIFSNPSEESINNRQNKFIMEYTNWFSFNSIIQHGKTRPIPCPHKPPTSTQM